MDYLSENWGSIVGLLGFLASVGGLVYAFLARRAAKSAEQAAREARQAVARTLSSIDVEQTVALIERLKEVHHQRNWAYALGLYAEVERTLIQIGEGIPESLTEFRIPINEAVTEITIMENLVRRSRHGNREPEDIPALDEALTRIRQLLERLQSRMRYSDESVSS